MSSFGNSVLNFANTNVNMQDAFDVFRRELMLSLNCHALATVQSFNSLERTVQATLNYPKTFIKQADDGTFSEVQKSYPVLLDVPIIVMSGGLAEITFPIATGDTCLILFNDRDMDMWLSTSQNGPVNTSRLHSFSDGIALVGLLPFPDALLESYDGSNLNLKVSLPAKIKLSNELTTLGTQLHNLLTQLNTLVTTIEAITVSSVPIDNAAAFIPIGTALSTISTQIGELLA